MTALPITLQPHLTALHDEVVSLAWWAVALSRPELTEAAARIRQRADLLRHDITAELEMSESRGHAAGVERACRELRR